MKKQILFASLVAAMMLPATSQAQFIFAGDLNAPLAATPCKLDIFEDFVAQKCAGFYDKNAIDFGTGGLLSSQALDAIDTDKLNVSATNSVLKVGSWNGGNGTFAVTMYGLTVVGMHWGNYADPVNNQTGQGNVSAFFLFDFGTTGTNTLELKDAYKDGISNFAILATCDPAKSDCGSAGGECTAGGLCTTVPEPSTYALMAAGLGALGFAARRRRRNNA